MIRSMRWWRRARKPAGAGADDELQQVLGEYEPPECADAAAEVTAAQQIPDTRPLPPPSSGSPLASATGVSS